MQKPKTFIPKLFISTPLSSNTEKKKIENKGNQENEIKINNKNNKINKNDTYIYKGEGFLVIVKGGNRN